jgi:hypothetical protein
MLKAALFALAAGALAPHSTLYSDGTPPARFQSDSAAIILFVSGDGVEQLCGKSPPGLRTMACTKTPPDKPPLMVMPNPCLVEYDYYAHLLCHELGHVNGWPATHGD